MKKLQIIMFLTLLTAGLTEFTHAMWGKPVETKAPVMNAPIEHQKVNNAKTNQIAQQSTELQSNAQEGAHMSKQINQQSQAAYDSSLAVKTVNAITNSATSAWN